MKASIAGRVRSTYLPKTQPLLPLIEAVIGYGARAEERSCGRILTNDLSWVTYTLHRLGER